MNSVAPTDLFATKGMEYIIVIGFLALLTVAWHLIRSPADAEGAGDGRRLDWRSILRGVGLPETDFLFHPGHAWARLSSDDDVAVVGWDDFARRLIGPAFTHHYGDGPRVTPVIDGGMVYAAGTQGRLLAVDRDSGEPRWQHSLVPEFEADLPSYGYSASPLVVGDRLVIEAGGKNAAYIAFDKKTGAVVWTSQDEQPAYSSPIHVSIGGVSQIVFWSARGVRALSSESGKLLWTHPWENFCPVSGDPLNTATPIFVAPDRIFLSSGIGAALLRVARTNDGFEIKTVWESDEMRADVNTGLALDGHIYGFDRSTLKALDVETGEVKWAARGFQRGSLIAADGHLIVLGESGNLALADAKPDAFTETGTAKILEGRNWTMPTLAGGRLYLRNHDELVCLNVGT